MQVGGNNPFHVGKHRYAIDREALTEFYQRWDRNKKRKISERKSDGCKLNDEPNICLPLDEQTTIDAFKRKERATGKETSGDER